MPTAEEKKYEEYTDTDSFEKIRTFGCQINVEEIKPQEINFKEPFLIKLDEGWNISYINEEEQENIEIELTNIILKSPEICEGILRAEKQFKEGKFLTFEQVFNHPL